MKICLAQLNSKVGDLQGNFAQLEQVVVEHSCQDLIVFPELFLTGFPPKDLLLRGDFLQAVQAYETRVEELSAKYPQVTLIIGSPHQESDKLYNSLLVVRNGRILAIQHKRELSRLRLFEEKFYFQAGSDHVLVEVGNEVLGLTLGLELDLRLASDLKKLGATVLLNSCALPFSLDDCDIHFDHLCTTALDTDLPIIMVNLVGANDELIFAGSSVALNSEGDLLGKATEFTAHCLEVELRGATHQVVVAPTDSTIQIYQAIILGLKDYVHKNSMDKVIIGLSGGLDSAVAAVLATRALGAEYVWGVTQPGPYSRADSVADAHTLANNLGIRFDILPISQLNEEVLFALRGHFSGTEINVAEENIQARLRGNLLMALSNKHGGLVLTNSNKSELAVGYCTLYGDMCGGLALLGDVYKTMVYQLAYFINREEEIIPWNTIEKPPSAELRPGQRDDQSLPPYDLLDGILQAYLDKGLTPGEIVASGHAIEMVQRVIRMVDQSEYKRRQTALILRVTTSVWGKEWQMPLTAQKNWVNWEKHFGGEDQLER